MSKIFYCRAGNGYKVGYHYEVIENLRQAKNGEVVLTPNPVKKYAEIKVTDLSLIEPNLKMAERKGFVDFKPRREDPDFEGGVIDCAPKWNIPITKDTLHWSISPDDPENHDIVECFKSIVKPIERSGRVNTQNGEIALPDGSMTFNMVQIGSNPTADIVWVEAKKGAEFSWDDWDKAVEAVKDTVKDTVKDVVTKATKKLAKKG